MDSHGLYGLVWNVDCPRRDTATVQGHMNAITMARQYATRDGNVVFIHRMAFADSGLLGYGTGIPMGNVTPDGVFTRTWGKTPFPWGS